MRIKAMRQHSKEQGAALAVSLILLVAMTILGVATLNGTRLAEKVSSNAQQKAIVFETAESVINAIETSDDLGDRFFAALGRFEPDAVPQTIEANAFSTDLDQTNVLGTSVDVDIETAEIQFCGEGPAQGSDINGDEDGEMNVEYQFDIRVSSTIANSRARADHVLRKGDPGISFGLRGKCVTPGT